MAALPGLPNNRTPEGLPGTEGISPGPSSGLPKMGPGPGPTAQGVPNPDRLVELFTSYTSGQMDRNELIMELAALSQGEGGILELLETLDQTPDSSAAQPGIQPSMPTEGAPAGAPKPLEPIPQLNEPLDKRHQRISMLLQEYGLSPQDADQMSTELNANPLDRSTYIPTADPNAAIGTTERALADRNKAQMVGGELRSSGGIQLSIGDRNFGSSAGYWDEALEEAVGMGFNREDVQYALQNQAEYFPATREAPASHDTFTHEDADIDDIPQQYGMDVHTWQNGRRVTNPNLTKHVAQLKADAEASGFNEAQHGNNTYRMIEAYLNSPAYEKAKVGLGGAKFQEVQAEHNPTGGQPTGVLVWDDVMGMQVDSGTRMPPQPDTSATVALGDSSVDRVNQVIPSAPVDLGEEDAAVGVSGDYDFMMDPTVNPKLDPSGIIPQQFYPQDSGTPGYMVSKEIKALSDADLSKFLNAPEAKNRPDYQQVLSEFYSRQGGDVVHGAATATPKAAADPKKDLVENESSNELIDAIKSLAESILTDTGEREIDKIEAQTFNILDKDEFDLDTSDSDSDKASNALKTSTAYTVRLSNEARIIGKYMSGNEGDDKNAFINDSVIAYMRDLNKSAPDTFKTDKNGIPNDPIEIEDFRARNLRGFSDLYDSLKTNWDKRTVDLAGQGQMGQGEQMWDDPLRLAGGTADVSAYPSLYSFLNGLTDAATTGASGEMLTAAAINAIGDLDLQRMRGNQEVVAQIASEAIATIQQEAANLRQQMQVDLSEGVALGQIGEKATLAAKMEESARAFEIFKATGQIPAWDPETGKFDTTGQKVSTLESKALDLSAEELALTRDLRMTELFGQTLKYEIDSQGNRQPIPGQQTLEGQKFQFTKQLQQAELTGKYGKPDPLTGEIPDTFDARRWAWEKDHQTRMQELEVARIDLEQQVAQFNFDLAASNQKLTAAIEGGRLQEAIAARRERTIIEQEGSLRENNQMRINTLLALADPATMLFASRYGLIPGFEAALGIEFGDDFIDPPPMVAPGVFPSAQQLAKASPVERRIMLAELAADDNIEVDAALANIMKQEPGGRQLVRPEILGMSR